MSKPDRRLVVGLAWAGGLYSVPRRWALAPQATHKRTGIVGAAQQHVPARRKPQIVMPTLQGAVGEGIILKGVRGEAAETVDLILKRLVMS